MKTFFFLLLGLLMLPAHADAAALSKPPNNLGLVSYWSFNEATSTIATDFSGNDNHGTLNGNATWTAGKRGAAVTLDGTGDYVQMSNEPDFERTDAFTISAWVKLPSATPSTPDTIVSKVNGSNVGYAISIRGDIANDPVEYELRGASTFLSIRSFQTWQAETWTHLVWTYDGSNTAAGMRLYRDGVVQSDLTDSENLTQTISNTSNLVVGAFGGAGANSFSGAIDEVRVYNRALSATEVAALYGSGAIRLGASSKTLAQGTTLASGLVGHWSFDGGDTNWTSETAGTVTDASGNGNTGTITNMTRSAAPAIGRLGQAFLFDDTDDYINLGNPASMRGLTSMSISAWVYPETLATPQEDVIFAQADGGVAADGKMFFRINDSSGNLRFQIITSAGTGNITTTSGGLVADVWSHVVGVWDGTTMYLYINGSQHATTASLSGTFGNSGLNKSIGANQSGGSRWFNGRIDDVRFYNRALSVAEIQQLYRLGQVTIVP